MHYFDPHGPYQPPEEHRKGAPRDDSEVERLRWLYEGEVRYVDHAVGRVFDALKQAGLYEDALIILTSDHGEEFGEHGGYLHGRTLYQEVLHVPLLVRMPGGAGARRLASYVPTHALLPTVLDVLGISATPHEAWPPSLAPLLSSNAEDAYDFPIVSGQNLYGEVMWSVVQRGYKFISYQETGREELFDLEADPSELHSTLDEHAAIAEEARGALERYQAAAARILADSGLTSAGGEDFLDRMRSLGYVQ